MTTFTHGRRYAGLTLPDLRGIEYHSSPNGVVQEIPTQPPSCRTICFSRWRQMASYFKKKKTSRIVELPNEILTLIALELPPAPCASLAITCKRLYAVNCSQSKFNPFQKIPLPAEQPSDFQSPRMSHPKIYHSDRWDFLGGLEKDLHGRWALCTECFTLHPKSRFAEYRRSIAPWLKGYYERHHKDYQSCRQGRKPRGMLANIAYYPSGVVDLCPCIKLTIGKKHSIEAWLRGRAQSLGNGCPAADFWWHQCQHTFSEVEIQTKIGIFLYDGTEDPRFRIEFATIGTNILSLPPLAGELGVLLEYHHTYPLNSTCPSPRLLCPHQKLQNTISDLLRCRETHPERRAGPDSVCNLCRPLQYCQQYRTKVLGLRSTKDQSTGLGHYSYLVERRLDDAIWPMRTIFPFARRQIPLQNRSSLPLTFSIPSTRRLVDNTWI